MSIFNDVMEFENEDQTPEDQAVTLQKLINEGSAWSFQGSYGRSMMEAINAGICMLGIQSHRDYYGNKIPSRDEVEQGTKGSYQFVVDNLGEDHAKILLTIK